MPELWRARAMALATITDCEWSESPMATRRA
jgi:hypothetical protein